MLDGLRSLNQASDLESWTRQATEIPGPEGRQLSLEPPWTQREGAVTAPRTNVSCESVNWGSRKLAPGGAALDAT